jgi:hypothetical protein
LVPALWVRLVRTREDGGRGPGALRALRLWLAVLGSRADAGLAPVRARGVMDPTDPHVAVGIEHATSGLARYHFEDSELQRRYDLGYDYGLRHDPVMPFAEFEQLMREKGYER